MEYQKITKLSEKVANENNKEIPKERYNLQKKDRKLLII